MVHSDKWFLQSTCLTDKCIQFEISEPVMTKICNTCGISRPLKVNPLRDELILGNMKIYLDVLSSVNTEMVQEVWKPSNSSHTCKGYPGYFHEPHWKISRDPRNIQGNLTPLSSCNRHLFILYSQYHGWWCPGDARSQGITSHDIDLLIPEYSNFSPREVNAHAQLCIVTVLTFLVWFLDKLKKYGPPSFKLKRFDRKGIHLEDGSSCCALL